MEKKSKAIKVNKKQAEAAIRLLDSAKARAKSLKPKAQGQFVVIPVKKLAQQMQNKLKKNKIKFEEKSLKFAEQPKKELTLKQALAKKLNKKESKTKKCFVTGERK